MRIPMGDFEAAGGPNPVEHTRVNTQGLTAGLEANARAAGEIANLAQSIQQHQQQEDDALGRAKAANALTEHDLRIRALTDDVSGRVQRGEIPYEKAEETYRSEAAKIEPPKLTLDPAVAEHYMGGVRNNVTAGELTIGNAVKQAKRDDGRAQFAAALDMGGKEAGMPGADIDKINADMEAWRPIARTFGLDDAVISNQLQNFKDRNWTNQATERMLASRNDIEGLKQLETDLTAKDGYYAGRLDTEKRNMVLGQVQARQAALANNIATDAAKAEVQAEKAVNFLADANATGIPLLPEKVLELQAVTAGTSHEQDFKDALAIGHEIAMVRTQPFATQQQYISQLEQQLQRGSADPKRDLARLNTLRSALDASRKQATENPMMFYQNQGGDPIEPIDFSTLTSESGRAIVESQLAQRYYLLEAMRKKYGADVSMNPWRPEEAAALKAALGQADANPDLKLMVLGVLSKNAPNARAYRDTLAPIAQSDRVSYVAGEEQYLGHQGGKNGPVAPIILNGARVLKDKSVPMPTEAKFQAAFDADVGNAYPPGSQERADAYLKYKTIYAGLAEKLPNRSEETDELEDTLRTTAGSLATGGLYEHAGAKVPKPFGMSDHDFEDRRSAEIEKIATDIDFPVVGLDRMPMMAVPGHEGAYFLINQGRVQVGLDKKPIVVRVK